jgi:nucleotide-binding universal stress UspA family protein
MARFRQIVHPTDFSPASGAAFKKALELAKDGRGEVVLLHVMAPVAPVVGEGYVSPAIYQDLQRAARAHTQKEMDRLLARARKAGVKATPLLTQGVIHDAIVRAAQKRRADVIVMGTHGRGGLSRLFLGSVASRVVGTARIPVLTVKG